MSSCNAGGQALYDNMTISSIFGNFGFSIPPVANQTIIGPDPDGSKGYFCKAVWDEIANWISQRHNLPTGYDGSDSEVSVQNSNSYGGDLVSQSTVQDVSPFSAREFNRIANIIHKDNAIYAV